MRKALLSFCLISLLAGTTTQCDKAFKTNIEVLTGTIQEQSYTSATIKGEIVKFGKGIKDYGHCWSTSPDPTFELVTKTSFGEVKEYKSFESELSNLNPNTLYHVRAYAVYGNKNTVIYGDEVSLTTLSLNMPVIDTKPVSSITTNSAVSGGNVTTDGGSPVTSRGVCWSTTENPTISASFTSDSSGTGSFTSAISGLDCGTSYYVRAYATNSVGTSYGSQVSFNTSPCPLNLPALFTLSVEDVTDTSATVGGHVTDDGGFSILETGIYWGTSANPQTTGSILTIGSSSGEFSTTLSGLSPGTTYYVTAYASNVNGESAGDEKSFATTDASTLLIDSESAINDTLQSCYSGLQEFTETLYLFDAVYSNNIPAPDGSWSEIHEHTQTSGNQKISNLWSKAYTVIYKLNHILESSDVIVSAVSRDLVNAQAKAMRAYLNYSLVCWFGDIPLQMGFTESMIGRNSVGEVVDLIEQDATEAVQVLPALWTGVDKTKIPGDFVKGLLARTSLFNTDVSQATASAEEIINNGDYSLSIDVNDYTESNPGFIWGFSKKDNTEFNYFFSKGSYVPMMQLSEIFLISAEARYRMGDNASALFYINVLRDRRADPALAFLTTDDLIQQWNTELASEGNMFIAFKRLDKATDVVPSEYRHLLPLPQHALDGNSYLNQNPGY